MTPPNEMGIMAVREDHGAARRIVLETEEWLDREMQKDMGQILSSDRIHGSQNTADKQNEMAAFSDNSKNMNFSTIKHEPSPNTLPLIVQGGSTQTQQS